MRLEFTHNRNLFWNPSVLLSVRGRAHGKLRACSSSGGSKPVVLVVEDSHIIRMCAVDLVVAAGFEALEASSADEAIQVLEGRSDIHLVFTDVSMPGSMDGIKLSHYIRKRWPPVKLIVVSGKSMKATCPWEPGFSLSLTTTARLSKR
jgi:two-component system, response regulator PdtaR